MRGFTIRKAHIQDQAGKIVFTLAKETGKNYRTRTALMKDVKSRFPVLSADEKRFWKSLSVDTCCGKQFVECIN